MRMEELRWLFLAVIAVALVLSFISEPVTFGISQQWTNGTYRFAGGTRPVALAFALIIVSLYLLLMFAPPANLGEPLPGVFRRFVTFWLDFILAMMVMIPLMGFSRPSRSGKGLEHSNGPSSAHSTHEEMGG